MKKHLFSGAFVALSIVMAATPAMAAMSQQEILNKYGNMTLNQIAAKADMYKNMNWAAALNKADPQKTAMMIDNLQSTIATLQGMLTTVRMYMTLRGATPAGGTMGMFMMGDHVWANADGVRVRATAGGSILGKVMMGAKGTVQGTMDSGGTTWVHVMYDNGMNGWSAADFLSK